MRVEGLWGVKKYETRNETIAGEWPTCGRKIIIKWWEQQQQQRQRMQSWKKAMVKGRIFLKTGWVFNSLVAGWTSIPGGRVRWCCSFLLHLHQHLWAQLETIGQDRRLALVGISVFDLTAIGHVRKAPVKRSNTRIFQNKHFKFKISQDIEFQRFRVKLKKKEL